jgi:hypothetical protein
VALGHLGLDVAELLEHAGRVAAANRVTLRENGGEQALRRPKLLLEVGEDAQD